MRALLIGFLLVAASDLKETVDEERAARDREFRSPEYASPLTAIDQVMIEPGGMVAVSQCDDRVRFTDGTTCLPLMEIRFDAGRFLVKPVGKTRGTWGPGTPFDRELAVSPGKSDLRGRLLLTEPEAVAGLALFFSMQENAGRAMLHDTRSVNLASFEGLSYYPVDERYHFVVRIEPPPVQETIDIATTQGLVKKFKRAGTVSFEVPEGKSQLTVFVPLDSPQLQFVPFRDTTNGQETYPMGRYLYLAEGPSPATYILDFNRAFNPSCVYSEYYNCPYPPPENHLRVPIPAGEKLFKKD